MMGRTVVSSDYPYILSFIIMACLTLFIEAVLINLLGFSAFPLALFIWFCLFHFMYFSWLPLWLCWLLHWLSWLLHWLSWLLLWLSWLLLGLFQDYLLPALAWTLNLSHVSLLHPGISSWFLHFQPSPENSIKVSVGHRFCCRLCDGGTSKTMSFHEYRVATIRHTTLECVKGT